MRRTIWTYWPEGRDRAPADVSERFAGWTARNPAWELRCLGRHDIGSYGAVAEYLGHVRGRLSESKYVDLASLLLLHEYGGVWLDPDQTGAGCLDEGPPVARPGDPTIARRFRDALERVAPDEPAAPSPRHPRPFAALKVSTDNLGDHIQIAACTRLLKGFGIEPTYLIDRDNELGSAPSLPPGGAEVPVVLNGWFKRNGAEWPPNARLRPLFIGFHIRLFQCPALVSPESLDYYRTHGPIGCRDPYTRDLLRAHGVEAYVSQCLSLTLPRRLDGDGTQDEVIVVSRDERLLQALPKERGPYRYVCHYTGREDFETNLREAETLLMLYRTRARMIVTSLLHCALPAIAMGIPVIVFHPINDAAGHQSDRERFSSLADLTPIYDIHDMRAVDWAPVPIDVADEKLAIHDRLADFIAACGR